MNSGADVAKFGAQNVSFGMEALGFQAWISIDLGRISGPPFGRFWPTLEQQLCFLAYVFAGNVF